MLRRAFLISSIMGVVSAAAALAFAPDLSRVGRVVSSLASWRTPGFTRAPSPDPLHRIVPSLTGQAPDSLQGKFCRFPVAAESGYGHESDSTVLATQPDASGLALEGQSQIEKPISAAICTGTTVPRAP
jgi:hypothetical protein